MQISDVRSTTMEKAVLAGETGIAHHCPSPFTLFTITYKVAVYAPAERADTLSVFYLYSIGMYSVVLIVTHQK